MDDHKVWAQSIFNRAAPRYGEEYRFFDHFGERLVSHVPLPKGAKVLDVATGKGAVLRAIAKVLGDAGHITGIDLSPQMLEESRKKNLPPNAELLLMDAEHLNFPDQTFDAVFCGFALFLFPNLMKALAEIKRVLKPGGFFATSIWLPADIDNWMMDRGKELGATRNLRANSLDTAQTLQEMLRQSNWSTVEIYEESKVFQFESAEKWWDNLWSHGRRAILEQLSEQSLQQLRSEMINRITSSANGLSQDKKVAFAIASGS